MARILIVEDDPDIQGILRFNLDRAGYDVRTASRGDEGLRLVRSHHVDLILLDLMLPDISGIEVCKILKRDEKTREIPLIVVSARGEEVDRILGLELGAEDYIVKPFSIRELLLRVQAVLKRYREAGDGRQAVEFGGLRVDRDAWRVWVEGSEVSLTALEFRLLVALYDRRGRVQSRALLLDDVWGIQASLDTRTVDTHVKRLREKLGNVRDYIETVRGVGYRFIASATVIPSGRPSGARTSSGSSW